MRMVYFCLTAIVSKPVENNRTIVSSQTLVLSKSFDNLLQKLELDSMNNPKMFDGGKIFCRGGSV